MKRSPSFDDFEFEDFFARMSRQLDAMSRQFEETRRFRREVAVDLREETDSFVAVADLPGFEREQIDISVSDRLLTIEAAREESTTAEEDRYVHRERRSDSIQRSIRLPAEVRAADADATYNNGVLTVTLPKRAVDEESYHVDIE
ncbi:Hsp20/alpha crystallin family protein [Halobellus sp. Atlit-31R]|nr:Hsp20/alpha crystallin family protein [Halobellus sp. Atlit-31R]